MLCDRKARRLRTESANEQNSKALNRHLNEQGTKQTYTASDFSSSNAIVERRLGFIFSAARSALATAPSSLCDLTYCFFAALDAINKENYLPFKREGILHLSLHTIIQFHDCDTNVLADPDSFLPFGQAGFIISTIKFKKLLDQRVIPANYLRCLSKTHIKSIDGTKRNHVSTKT